MSKVISATADDRTAAVLDQLAKLEDRSVAQLAASALQLYALLPSPAHAALRYIKAVGGSEAIEEVSRDIARVLLHRRYELAEQRTLAAMQVEERGEVSETELLQEAVAATRSDIR